MKWREPWRQSLCLQEPFNLFSASLAKSGTIWALMFLGLFAIQGLAKGFSTGLLERAWIAIPAGFLLAAFIYVVTWLSPRSIDSGPRGIIHIKGGSITLIPWAAIRKHEIQETPHGRALVLTLAAASNTVVLLLPSNADTPSIESELRAKVPR